MNSNRFIYLLTDQNLIRIIKISTLKFMPSTGTFDLIFNNAACFLGILNSEGFCRKFVLIWTFSFYEYLTDVLCVVFLKILIKYFFIKSYYHYYYCHFLFSLSYNFYFVNFKICLS